MTAPMVFNYSSSSDDLRDSLPEFLGSTGESPDSLSDDILPINFNLWSIQTKSRSTINNNNSSADEENNIDDDNQEISKDNDNDNDNNNQNNNNNNTKEISYNEDSSLYLDNNDNTINNNNYNNNKHIISSNDNSKHINIEKRSIQNSRMNMLKQQQHHRVESGSLSYTQLGFLNECVSRQVHNWNTITHVDIIHRQGLKVPDFTFEVTKNSNRPLFRLFCPTYSTTDPVLLCRQKTNQFKFRFSKSEKILTKKNNPNYIGKMNIIKSNKKNNKNKQMIFIVSLANDILVEKITIECGVNNKICKVEMLNQYLNLQEYGRSGREMSGTIQTFLNPRIRLQLESKRHILELKQYTDDPNKYRLNFDYPMTAFIGFAVCVAVDSWNENNKK